MTSPSRTISEANAHTGRYPNTASIPSISINGKQITPNPRYAELFPIWTRIRDFYAGEHVVKAAKELYLRRPSSVEAKDYDSYLSRAYFYNATRRTHTGLLGSVMRKRPEYTFPTNLDFDENSVTLDGMSILEFVTEIISEQILISRYGVLVDLPTQTPPGERPQPYFSGYKAESIYYVRTRLYRGRKIVDRIVLIEEEEIPDDVGTTTRQMYRVLRLDSSPTAGEPDRLVYSQDIVRPARLNGETESVKNQPFTIQGRTINYIPFVFFSPKDLLPTIKQPLLSDIAAINLSHYESTALLEHGRFYAGMPTYYIAGKGAGDSFSPGGEAGLGGPSPMSVGPSNVWLLEEGDKCGLLEFTGHGLTFIENAVDAKQLQMQSLGGKLVGPQQGTAALSTEAYGLMETGDEATLLDISQVTERGLTILLNYANDLQNNQPDSKTLVELNKEFIRSELTARELRAMQSLYERGLVPVDVLYYNLRQIGIIPLEYTLEDYKAMLDNPAQKYKNPDLRLEYTRLGSKNENEEKDRELERERLKVLSDRSPPTPTPTPAFTPKNPT